MATTYHEPYEELPPEARDQHRILTSLIEELEAVDWYNQRAAVTADEEAKKILIHNRDEEIEHAAMCLEWLRRQIPKFDEELRTYLFKDVSIVEIEEAEEGGSEAAEQASASGSLNIGKFKKGDR